MHEPPVIDGHPMAELEGADNPVLITVCANCGNIRSILWLTGDRWFCRTCRAEGAKPPNLYPIG